MRRKFELSETDIKQAIAAYVRETTGATSVSSADVYLTATENYDFADRKTGSFSVSAIVTENDNG